MDNQWWLMARASRRKEKLHAFPDHQGHQPQTKLQTKLSYVSSFRRQTHACPTLVQPTPSGNLKASKPVPARNQHLSLRTMTRLSLSGGGSCCLSKSCKPQGGQERSMVRTDTMHIWNCTGCMHIMLENHAEEPVQTSCTLATAQAVCTLCLKTIC